MPDVTSDAMSFSLFSLSWASLAAYVGLTTFLVTSCWQPRLAVLLFTSATILITTIFFLTSRHPFYWLDRFNFYYPNTVPTFSAGRFLLNACYYSGMILSLLSARHFPPRQKRHIRLTSLLALTFAFFWTETGRARIFLPLIFSPDGKLALRLIFIAIFLAIGTATFCQQFATSKSDSTDPSTRPG